MRCRSCEECKKANRLYMQEYRKYGPSERGEYKQVAAALSSAGVERHTGIGKGYGIRRTVFRGISL